MNAVLVFEFFLYFSLMDALNSLYLREIIISQEFIIITIHFFSSYLK